MALRAGFVGPELRRPSTRREGAKPASSPRDLAARCDVIGVCVRDDADVRAVVEDEGRR